MPERKIAERSTCGIDHSSQVFYELLELLEFLRMMNKDV
jgi:hypothetical protein